MCLNKTIFNKLKSNIEQYKHVVAVITTQNYIIQIYYDEL